MNREVQRVLFYLDYCKDLKASELMTLWWKYQNHGGCLKLFAEWCFAKGVLKIGALAPMHKDMLVEAKNLALLLLSQDDLDDCGRIGLRDVRIPDTIRRDDSKAFDFSFNFLGRRRNLVEKFT
jgi:hypothetical protein